MSEKRRDNFWTGVFLLIGLALIIAGVALLSDAKSLLAKKQQVQVRFSLNSGVKGLAPGGAVTIGSVPAGEVIAIAYITDASSGVINALDVTFDLPAQYRVFENAIIELNAPPLGSGTELNIRSFGAPMAPDANAKPQGGSWDYQEGEVIDGTVATSRLAREFLRAAGIDDHQRRQMQETIANLRDLSGALASGEVIPPGGKGRALQQIILSMRDMTERLTSQTLPHAEERVKAVLDGLGPIIDDARAAVADVRIAAADVRSVTDDYRERSLVWGDRIDRITDNTDRSLSTVQTLLKDTDPQLRQIVENVDVSTTHIRTTNLDQLTAALASLDASMATLQKLAAGQRPRIESLFANAQVVSQQLKLAAIEVRRSPWRLLYSPSDEELETDNLYDAATTYALAASDLEAAAASLKAVQDAKGDLDTLNQTLSDLNALFSKFEKAEQVFWKELNKRDVK